jgi:Ser/Thr protein kinase RdoA (MazF antagonist)
MTKVEQAAENFIGHDETIAGIEKYGSGIIHDTYLVKLDNGANRFILQRINKQVFAKPEAIMHNLQLVCGHIQERMKGGASRIDADWQMLQRVPAGDGRDYYVDADGDFWRALSFIREAVPLEQITCLEDARQAGRALGIFHWLTSDLDPGILHETLPGFHNIEHYLKHYAEVIARNKEAGEAGTFCQHFIENRKGWAAVLENGRRENQLRTRVIHGDPKISNIMINRITGKAASIIDLDTVMPGLVQYDIGDCLRSCCNTEAEDGADFSAVRFDLERCEAFLYGYTGTARVFLTGTDFDFLYDAIRLIPFELGLRFYTDFQEGNLYFRVDRQGQNLDRALVQFKLVESIEQQEDRIRVLIDECRGFFAGSDST